MKKYPLESVGISASMLTTFLQCKQKARLAVYGMQPISVGIARTYGILTHTILETIGIGFNQKAFPSKLKIITAVRKACDEFEAESGQRWGAKEAQAYELECAHLEAVIPAYYEYYQDKMQAVALEGKFKVPFRIGNLQTFLIGIIDAATRLQKELWIWDHKTSARISELELFAVLSRDFQMNFYIAAMFLKEKRLPGGVYYNIIRRPGLQLKKGETIKAHIERTREHIAEDEEHYFKRFEIAVDKDDVAAFISELEELILEFRDWIKKGMPFRLYGMPCVGRYGLCEMHQWCYERNITRFKWRFEKPSRKDEIWTV